MTNDEMLKNLQGIHDALLEVLKRQEVERKEYTKKVDEIADLINSFAECGIVTFKDGTNIVTAPIGMSDASDSLKKGIACSVISGLFHDSNYEHFCEIMAEIAYDSCKVKKEETDND